MKKEKPVTKVPKFKSEDEEATWWASTDGREFLKLTSFREHSSSEEERIDLSGWPKPDQQRADRTAIARARCRQSPRFRWPQGHRIPDAFENDRA